VRKKTSAKKTKKPVLSNVLSILFWLCMVFVVTGLVMTGGLFISDNLKRWTAAHSKGVETGNIPTNKVDPISSKPIMPGITSTYQQYIIGHCCADSKIEWNQLRPEQKAEKFQSFLSSSTSPL